MVMTSICVGRPFLKTRLSQLKTSSVLDFAEARRRMTDDFWRANQRATSDLNLLIVRFMVFNSTACVQVPNGCLGLTSRFNNGAGQGGSPHFNVPVVTQSKLAAERKRK